MRTLPALAACMVLATPAVAVETRSFSDHSADAFSAGELQGVSVRGEGELGLAAGTRSLHEQIGRRIWSVAVDDRGRVWAATGGEGRLYRLDPGEEPLVALQVDESEVLAVAATGKIVFAASGPDGRVYRLRGGAEPEVWFDPPEPYVWDLAVGREGTLFVATGEGGRIYQVTDDGESSLLYDSPEPHVRCLALDSQGRLLAGTDGMGYVYRFDDAGRPSVLFVSPQGEVTDIAVGRDGRIFVATLGGGKPSPERADAIPSGGVARLTVVASADPATPAPSTPSSKPVPVSPARPASPASPAAAGSAVHVLAPDGSVRRLFQSPTHQVLSLSPSSSGELIAGTAANGALLSLSADAGEALVAELEASQVPSMARTGDGRLIAATANPGHLVEVAAGIGQEGTFVSEVKDAVLTSRWGRLTWEAEVPDGTALEVRIRTGNTARPDDTWSDWSEPYSEPEGSAIDRPGGRFLQYRVDMRSAGDRSPLLYSLEIFYLERNLPPEVESLTMLAPGIVMLSQRNQQPPDQEAVARAEAAANGQNGATRASTRKTFQEGMRTLTWKAFDPNEDALRFDVDLRAEGESAWRPLQHGLEEEFLSFDSRQIADGRYRLRVVDRDSLANPPEHELSGSRVGGPVDIDNTPPQVIDLAVGPAEGSLLATFVVQDAVGPVRRVRYSVDAAPWVLVLPKDGVADGRWESFVIDLSGLRPGSHSLVVQATDASGNSGSGRQPFTTR